MMDSLSFRSAIAAVALVGASVFAAPTFAADDPPKSCPRKKARPANPFGSVLIPTVVEAREPQPVPDRNRGQSSDAEPAKKAAQPPSEKAAAQPQGEAS